MRARRRGGGAAWLFWALTATAWAQTEGAVVHEETTPPAPKPVLTKPPQLLKNVEPTFPEEAKKERLTGDVLLHLDIGETGQVTAATVIKSAGHGFDEAAIDAAKQMVFSPAEVDGKPAPIRIQFEQHFIFKEPPPPATDRPVELPLSLKGRVVERGTRKPVAGAAVKIPGVDPVITDATGHFEARFAPGPVQVEVVEPHYQKYQTKENIKPGEQLEVTYYLMPNAYGLYETVVRGEREKKEVSRRTLQREELEKVPGSLGDPLRVIQDLPGVARAPFLSGLLIIRGTSPNDSASYMDQVQLPLLYHFGGGPSVINPEFLDRIDFYPGGFGPEYGHAIGGIIDIFTRGHEDDRWHGSAKIDLIDTGVYLDAPIAPGLSVAAAARRSYIDVLLPPILGALGAGGTLISPRYYDYQFRADDHPKGSRNYLKLFFFGSDDMLSIVTGTGVAGPAGFSINNHVAFQRLVGTWVYRNDRFTSTFEPYVGLTLNSIGVQIFRNDQNDSTGGLQEKLEYEFGSAFILRGGVDIIAQRSSISAYSVPPPADYRSFPGEQATVDLVQSTRTFSLYDYAGWVEPEIRLPFHMKILPGLRAEAFRVRGDNKNAVDPRLTIRQELSLFPERPTVLKGSIGLYHQQPTLSYLDKETGNQQLPLESAFQTSLGVEQKVTDVINFDLTGFYTRRYDLGERVSDVVDGTPIHYDGSMVGRSYGVEVFLRHEISRNFFGWLSYTLSWSQERNKWQSDYHWARFDQRHILTLIAQYKFGNGWELGGRYRLATGNPDTPYLGSTFDADTDSYHGIAGTFGDVRQPTFTQLDLRVDKTWLFNTFSLGVYLDVQNVLNTQNQEAIVWDYRYQTSLPIPSIPILPTLGVKGTF